MENKDSGHPPAELLSSLINKNGGLIMSKDSQPDNKKARKKKANGQTPITQENQNQHNNVKKQSNRKNDV